MMARRIGRTHLYTRRERRHRLMVLALAVTLAVGAMVMAGVAVGWVTGTPALPRFEFRPPVAGGDGGLLGVPTPDGQPRDRTQVQVPVAVSWPTNPAPVALVAILVWMALLRLTRPLFTGLRGDARRDGLASLPAIRRAFGAAAVRRTTRHTLPGTTRWERWLAPRSACGYELGRPAEPRARWPLCADWEQRIRIVARPGWGKTTRLLIPIIRHLPGPALVSSTEPHIFEATVLARQQPARRTRWRTADLVLDRFAPQPPRPVAVVDFSDPGHRWAAGHPQIHWNLITGCDDFTVAHRRATALLGGVRPARDHGNDNNDRFFRDSATEVLAAWLHAAALADRGVDDLARWLGRPSDPTPTRILEDDRRAEPSTAINLATHLDHRAAKTSSGVQRFLTLAGNALTTRESRRFCGAPDLLTGEAPELFDMSRHLAANGTVYVLVDPSRVGRVRPLLSLFVAETFLVAEQLALRRPEQRLPLPFIAVLDELRDGVTVPNLPYVATAQRKHGIGFVYAVQSSSQEDAVYGPDAQALRDAAGVTIIGGIDITTARELTDRAGTTPVVTATQAQNRHSEQVTHQPALTIADQQRLPDGHAVVHARGLAPFLAVMPSALEGQRGRRLRREVSEVQERTATLRGLEAVLRDISQLPGANP